MISKIKQGDSQTVEFKTSFQKEVIGSVVTFANSNGGKIVLNVECSILNWRRCER